MKKFYTLINCLLFLIAPIYGQAHSALERTIVDKNGLPLKDVQVEPFKYFFFHENR